VTDRGLTHALVPSAARVYPADVIDAEMAGLRSRLARAEAERDQALEELRSMREAMPNGDAQIVLGRAMLTAARHATELLADAEARARSTVADAQRAAASIVAAAWQQSPAAPDAPGSRAVPALRVAPLTSG